jgi:cysteine desulfurase family protein (TIGR01976 family)
MAIASVEQIRAQFPALSRRTGDWQVAYFDAPGGTQVPLRVATAVSDYLLHHNANTHWNYDTSRETDRIIAEARRGLADFLGGEPDEIAFGPNMTTLTFHLGRALGRQWGSGDEIVVTELEHHANLDTWRALEAERGISLQVARMLPATGELDWDDLQRRIGPRTRLLAIGAASNALGTVNDVPRAVALARAVGALVFVDAVHYAPHEPIDVVALGCDLLACSPYKFYGPHLGVLWGRRDLLQALDVPRLAPAPNTGAQRLETGTQNHEGIAGATAAVEFLAGLDDAGPAASRRHRLVHALRELKRRADPLLHRLWMGLSDIPGVTLYGPPPGKPRTPTLAFTVEDVSAGQVADRLSSTGLFLSHGDFYAATVVHRLGVPGGLVRAGCAAYTTAEEVDRLVEGVRALA